MWHEEPILAVAVERNSGDLSLVRLLIENGADINGTDMNGYTALMEAARCNDPACLRFLISHNANGSKRNGRGRQTAIAIALDMRNDAATAVAPAPQIGSRRTGCGISPRK